MEEILFDNDPAYQEQNEAAEKFEILQQTHNFIKYKIVNCCENCNWRDDGGQCHVMEKYGVPPFDTVILGKCSHWKKKEQ